MMKINKICEKYELEAVSYIARQFPDMSVADVNKLAGYVRRSVMKGIAEYHENVEKSYIKCILNDGTVLDFDKLCNEISTLDKNFVKFMLTNPKTHDYTTLGAIPIANIKMIDFVKSKDDIDAVLGIAVKEG